MADEWDDDPVPARPVAATKKYVNNNDEWDDSPGPAKPAAKTNPFNNAKAADDGWDDNPKPAAKSSTSNGWNNNDDGWGNDSANNTAKSNDWGSDNKKPFGNRNNNDRPRRPDWICSQCSARVFANKTQCFKCQADKGDSKDAPPDDGSSGGRGARAKDWICDACNARVFGNRAQCFKCQADKGDSKDAPDDGGFRGGRAKDWICDGCGAKVFGSKSQCFKCKADKGDSKDAPDDDSSSRNGGGGGWGNKKENDGGWGSKNDGGDDGWGDDNKTEKKSFGGGGGGDKPKPGGKPGDWNCECGVSNFASRSECFKCHEAKPEGAGGSSDDPKFNSETPKEFYIPEEVQAEELFTNGISTGINFSKFNDIPVQASDIARDQVPKPCKTFAETGLNSHLLSNIQRCNYTTPTPIQQNGIPIIKAKRDLMACAQTGSGKTAAFLLPMIDELMSENAPLNIAKPYVVIVTPTRELCTQIYNEARKFAEGSIIKCCQIYGGTATRHQNSNLNNGCHILVATPGRLKDFCDRTYITFENLRYFVLDEADRMLDMGFKSCVEEFMNNPTMCPKEKRQTLMFSATFPTDIQRLAGKYLHEYIFLTIGKIGGASSDVVQTVHEVGKFKKRDKLMELLNSEDPRGTIVFVETKRNADFLASYLSESEHPTTSIHGDRKQSQREEALRDFKNGKMKVLIATSVCARGLDIPGVRHVVNYDVPKSIEDYVHRIGRTGRVGNVGKATSFFDPEQDSEIASELVRILKESNQKIPDFLASSSSGGGGGGGGGDTFGGTDIRQNNSAQPAAHGGGGDDEEW